MLKKLKNIRKNIMMRIRKQTHKQVKSIMKNIKMKLLNKTKNI